MRNNAAVSAKDDQGRGALHCALFTPHIFDGWRSQRLVCQGVHVSRCYNFPKEAYNTEDTAHAEDFDHEDMADVEWNENVSALAADQSTLTTSEISARPSTLTYDLDHGGIPHDITSNNPELQGYVFCKDLDGTESLIRNPIKVLKVRLMFKLLTLLRAGCDPNVLDKAGLPPSHYARRDGLWPQWYWALVNSGYTLDAKTDRWSR